MTLDLFYQTTTALSVLAFLVSIIFFAYVMLKTRKLNPYTIFALGTAKAIMSGKFRDIVLLTLMSALVLFTAYFVKFLFGNKLFYKIFEISALLLFLTSAGLLLITYFQQEKRESKRVSLKKNLVKNQQTTEEK